ncbi:exosome complex component RRP43-like [Salvia divinorum]|uniref:Exosome complex component RRP43-like n=1 Tax=Salvia divinorum TaxID=28513 RepID=A0ABD1GZU4_SALDI
MAAASGTNDLSPEMELDAFRLLFPLRFHEQHLLESIRLDRRPLGRARDTSLSRGFVTLLIAEYPTFESIGAVTFDEGCIVKIFLY